jgi:hypothetical protein
LAQNLKAMLTVLPSTPHHAAFKPLKKRSFVPPPGQPQKREFINVSNAHIMAMVTAW